MEAAIIAILLVTGSAGALFGGGYYLAKKRARKKRQTLPEKKQKLIDMVEEDFTDLKRDLLVKELQKYTLDEGFAERLPKVHALFEEKNYRHPRAHTFYTTLLPRLLEVKKAKGELSKVSEDTVETVEMYASLNQWMDEIIKNKIGNLEDAAEINAKVITLLTK